MKTICPILLQGAMELEIEYFKEIVSNLEEIEVQGYKFYKGTYQDYPIVISKTNIGILESGIATYIGITKFNPKFIINQGTAGGYSRKNLQYDIVIGEHCININSYRTKIRKENQGSNPFEWELLSFREGEEKEQIELKANTTLLDIAFKCANKYKKGKILRGTIGSGDVWNEETDRIKWFYEMYGIQCEEMETYSVYSVCNKLHIPVIGIRVISNNEVLQQTFDKKTALELQKYVIEIVKELIKMKGE